MPRRPSGGDALAESLSYSVQLSNVTLQIPPRVWAAHVGAPCALYLKWTRGKNHKVKFEPIPFPASCFRHQSPTAGGKDVRESTTNAGRGVKRLSSAQQRRSRLMFAVDEEGDAASAAAAKAYLLTVPLPSSFHAAFDIRVSGPKVRKLWEVEFILLRYSDGRRTTVKERTVLANLQEDVCQWLTKYRVRVGLLQPVTLVPSLTALERSGGSGSSTPISALQIQLLVTPTMTLVNATMRENGSFGHSLPMPTAGEEGGDNHNVGVDEAGAKLRFPLKPLLLTAASSTSSSQQQQPSSSPQTAATLTQLGASFRNLLNTSLPTTTTNNNNSANNQPILLSAFSSLDTIVEEGLFRAIRFPRNKGTVTSCIETAFEALFGNSTSQPTTASTTTSLFGSMLHRTRDDVNYQEQPFSFYSSSHKQSDGKGTSGSLASRSTRYRLRIGKEKYVDNAMEWTVMCATTTSTPKGGEDGSREEIDGLAVHMSTFAPEAPIVGDKVRLEIFMHLFYEGGSSGVLVAAIHLYPCVLSGKIKFMFGSKINHQAEKLLNQVDQTVRACLSSAAGASAHRKMPFRRSAVFGGGIGSERGSMRRSMLRSSMRASVFGAAGSSLDPNLWRRLADESTLPHAEHVQHLLARLVTTTQTKRPSPSQVLTLENVMGYHRQNIEVVGSCCRLLLLMSRQGSAAWMAGASPTLAKTVNDVLSLYSTSGCSALHTEQLMQLLQQLQDASRRIAEAKAKEALEDRNYWATLDRYAADVDVVDAALSAAGGAAAGERSGGGGKSVADLLHPAATGHRRPAVGTSGGWSIATLVPTMEEHARVLCRVLSLHLQHVAVCRNVLLLFQCALETRETVFRQWLCAIPPLTVAIRAALMQLDLHHHHGESNSNVALSAAAAVPQPSFVKLRDAVDPNTLKRHTNEPSTSQLNNSSSASDAVDFDVAAFRSQYGSIVAADDVVVYAGYVMVHEPWVGLHTLYLTRGGYFCLGSHVVTMSKNVRRLELCRRLLQPAVRFGMIATLDDYVVAPLGSRERLLDALESLGYGSLVTR